MTALAEAVSAGEPVPEVVLACAGSGDAGEMAAAARMAARQMLDLLQGWLADERWSETPLVVLTRGAVAAVPGEQVPDLAGAAVRGLVRSAQSENPGRMVLADLSAATPAAVLAAALASGEPELAVRGQVVYGRRLAHPSGDLVRSDPVARREAG